MEEVALEAFVQHLPPQIRDAAQKERTQWQPSVAAAIKDAEEAWPSVRIPDEDFLAYVAQRLPADANVTLALEKLCTNDLYLACACVRGEKNALAAFQKAFFSHIRGAVAHLDPSRALSDDVQQVLSMRLFVAATGESPKVTGYNGKGNLKSWVRAAAIRTAINLRRKEGREVPAEENALAHMVDEKNDPELLYLKETYRAEFKLAFASALGKLTSRQRNLLRHQVLDKMSIDQIAVVYRVHRATAARWVVDARTTLVKTSKKLLGERLRISARELDSLIALVESRLYQSLSGVLRQAEP